MILRESRGMARAGRRTLDLPWAQREGRAESLLPNLLREHDRKKFPRKHDSRNNKEHHCVLGLCPSHKQPGPVLPLPRTSPHFSETLLLVP